MPLPKVVALCPRSELRMGTATYWGYFGGNPIQIQRWLELMSSTALGLTEIGWFSIISDLQASFSSSLKWSPSIWTVWLLRTLQALLFSGPLCFSVSALCPLAVPQLTSTHPCFLSHPVSRLYPGNFPIMCNEELGWAAGMGKQTFSLLLPKLVETVIFQ